jgi:hypothetical protein
VQLVATDRGAQQPGQLHHPGIIEVARLAVAVGHVLPVQSGDLRDRGAGAGVDVLDGVTQLQSRQLIAANPGRIRRSADGTAFRLVADFDLDVALTMPRARDDKTPLFEVGGTGGTTVRPRRPPALPLQLPH